MEKKVLPMDGEYLVLVGVNEEGEADTLLVYDHPQFGRTVRLFSNEEELERYLETVRDAEFGYYSKMTVEELAPELKANEVNQVVIDRGSDGWWARY